MAKNKLLTIPIEEEKRERLNQYCGDRGKTVSQMITGFIDKLLDGSIDPLASIESSRPPIEIDMAAIVEEVASRLKETHYVPAKEFNRIVREISLEMADIKNDLWLMGHSVKNTRELINSVDVKPKASPTVPESISDVEQSKAQHPKPYTSNSTEITHIPKSIATATTEKSIDQPLDQSLQPYTLEDTKTYLRDKCDYNRTRERRGDRIPQQDIAIHLQTYNYPHPSGRKWNRDEIRAVCKLWEFRT